MGKKQIMRLQVHSVRPAKPDMIVVHLSNTSESKLPHFLPGQFLELNLSTSPAMLNRPFSVYFADRDGITLLVKIVGSTTHALATACPGTAATAIGPLGKPFGTQARRPLLVGGGVGIAPVHALAQAYASDGIRPTVILGSRTAIESDIVKRLRNNADVAVCTDDGSEGFHGVVTACPQFRPECHDIVQCCGPTPMMKAVAAACATAGTDCEVSLENKMACGLGACLCCVQDTADGSRKCVCTEGPIFNAKEVVW